MAAEIIKLCNYHNLDDYRLSEVSQRKKIPYNATFRKNLKKDTNEHMYNTLSDSIQTQSEGSKKK